MTITLEPNNVLSVDQMTTLIAKLMGSDVLDKLWTKHRAVTIALQFCERSYTMRFFCPKTQAIRTCLILICSDGTVTISRGSYSCAKWSQSHGKAV